MKSHKTFFGFIFSILILTFSLTQAATYYVDPDGNDLNAGTSWATAFRNIQTGVDAATSGNVIEVNEGTYYGSYYENINFNGKKVVLRSTDPNDWDVVAATIIDGNGSGYGVVAFGDSEDSNSVLSGLTLRNGSVGVRSSGGSPVIKNCIISNNWEGVLVLGGSPVIENCIISNNWIEGIICEDTVTPIIRNNWIYGNGIDEYDGYGLYFHNATGAAAIVNNTIADNDFGVYIDSGTVPSITNSIIWRSTYGDLNYCSATYSCIEDNDSGIGNIHSDPCFVDADANNFHLLPASLCINAGDPNYNNYNEVDIDGEPRIRNSRVDMGADEFWLARFRIKNDAGLDTAWFDNFGNVALKGTLDINSIPAATTRVEFRFRNSNGNDVAIIDANSGNMYIAGNLFENQITLQPLHPNSDFIIKDGKGDVVSYINELGDLYLKGKVINLE